MVSANRRQSDSINQVEPIYVTFAVPEAKLTDIKQYMAQGKLPVVATTQDGAAAEEHGELTFIDNTVDTTTGTIKLKGTFPNTDHKLWPGQYRERGTAADHASERARGPEPGSADGQDGQFIYVVTDDRTVAARPVTVGASRPGSGDR